MKNFLYCVVAALLLPLVTTACSSSKHIRLQGNRFDLPETLPSGQYEATLEMSGATEIRLSPDEAQIPADVDAPEFSADSGQAGLRFGYSPKPKLEVQIQSMPNLSKGLQGYPAIKAKYQYRGPDLRSAKQGDISLATSVGVAYAEDKTSTAGNPSYVNEMQTLMLDIAGIGGYRYTDDVLFYGGPFLTPIFYRGDNKRVSFTTTDQRESFNGNALQWGLNLGAAYFQGEFWALQAELAYTGIRWKSSSDGFTHVGFQITRYFE